MRFKLGVTAKVAGAVAVAYGSLGMFGSPAFAVATNSSGFSQITNNSTNKYLASGGSATTWTINFIPTGASAPTAVFCSKDSASGGYHTFGYVVPSTVDPNTLTFNATSGPSQGFPLVDSVGTPFIAENTAISSGQVLINASGPGTFNWSAFSIDGRAGSAMLAAGTYNVGIACATNTGAMDKYWNEVQTFSASAADPQGEVWTSQAPPPPTAVPESPLTIALPVSAAAVLGASVFTIRRRRRDRGAPVTA